MERLRILLSDRSSPDRFRKSGSFGRRLTRILTLTFDSAPNSILPTTQFCCGSLEKPLSKETSFWIFNEMAANKVSNKLMLKYSKMDTNETLYYIAIKPTRSPGPLVLLLFFQFYKEVFTTVFIIRLYVGFFAHCQHLIMLLKHPKWSR